MKIFPGFIQSDCSRAEEWVYEKLKASNPGEKYCAFHSLLISDHVDRKIMGESDFVILTPAGLLIIEVKGGIISVEDRVWFTKNRKGAVSRLKESPFKQASGNMFSHKEELERASLPFEYKRHLLGFGVIFPNCKFQAAGSDIIPEILLDSETGNRNVDSMGHFINRLEGYWSTKLAVPWNERGPQEFSKTEFNKLLHWLKPRHHGVKSLRAEKATVEQSLISLADDQMYFLQSAREKMRIMCSGGAGTGKTVVGLEYARLCSQKSRCLFVVPNGLFKNFLIGKGYAADLICSFSELSAMADDSLDMVVLDEAQDVMTMYHFDAIDRVLVDGIKGGRWLIFHDSKNQRGIDGNFDQDCYDILLSYSDHDFILPVNIRNPEEIIRQTYTLTGKDIGLRGNAVGGYVQWLKYRDKLDLRDNICHILQDYLGKGLDLGDITVIGKSVKQESLVSDCIEDLGYDLLEVNDRNVAAFPFESLAYAPIRQFKGLESFVVILDLGEFDLEELEGNLTYVGITRSVSRLVLVYPRSYERAIGHIQLKRIQPDAEGVSE